MQIMESLPDWAVLHVPHNSTQVPNSVRDQFVLDDLALQEELIKMTDARVAVDAVNGWSGEKWQGAGFEYIRLGASTL